MDEQTFSSLFKDLISRLYDRVAIETHPLAAAFPVEPAQSPRRAEVIQRLILEEIKQLKPQEQDAGGQSSEWRSYQVLHQRYVEGKDPHEIARSLFIGDRQFRRDHSRALQALSRRVWQRYFQPDEPQAGTGSEELTEQQAGFEFHAEALDLNDVIRGVVKLIGRRLEEERIDLRLDLCPQPLQVTTDRILLRQIILSLINYVFHLRGRAEITLSTESGSAYGMRLLFDLDEQWANIQSDEKDSLEFACHLCHLLPARVEQVYPAEGKTGQAEVRLLFGEQKPRAILVLDDQKAALQMYQRYLSRLNLEVTGITEPARALEMAQKNRPALIILDVMMPHIDGWEVLQNLQLNPATRDIPVVVCSAWVEPELARSLGAAAFLKKPVIQKDLLEVFKSLGILQEKL